MKPSLAKEYSFIRASNEHIDISKNIIFNVLEEYGLKPGQPDLDGDLNDIDKYYSDGYFGLVLNDLGNFIGTFALYKIDGQTAEIRKMYLSPKERGKGIGKWMLHFLMEKAKDLGFQKVQLLTASPLVEAIELYRKNGFIEITSPESSPRCDKAFYKML